MVTRRAFLYSSAAVLANVSVLKSSSALVLPQRSSPTDYSSAIEKIKQLLPIAMAMRDITGASIALVDGDNIVWSEGFGYTNRSLKVKVTGDTLFHAGSISKSFAALGALKAVEKNLIDLDAPLKKYLPWFSVNSRFGGSEVERITIRHLLAHHSGLGTWAPLGNPSDTAYHTRTFEEVVKSTTGSWLKSPAGERFEYCNQGIDLAGYALAVVSGKSYEDFMREEILVPLGMTTSTFNQREATAKEACATGYLGKRSVPIVNGVVHPLVAAGGLLASANDLARFIIFHLQSGAAKGKQILPATLLKEMHAPQFTAKHQISGYGLGIYKALQNDTVRFSHGGLGYGISTHYRFLPEHKIGVVLLTNQDTAHNAPQLAGRVIELMLTAKLGTAPKNNPVSVKERRVVSLGEETLRRLEGTYLLYEGILFHFRYEKGDLFHILGNEKLKLASVSPTEFVSGSRLYRFLLAENGRPKGVQIIDDYYDPQTAENSVIYLHVNDTPGDAQGLRKSEWSRLTGKYAGTFIGVNSEVKVSLENGHLYLNERLKLREHSTKSFICADGESVIFEGDQLLVGNKLYFRKG